MNLINDNLDLKKIYKYQIDEIDSDKKYKMEFRKMKR